MERLPLELIHVIVEQLPLMYFAVHPPNYTIPIPTFNRKDGDCFSLAKELRTVRLISKAFHAAATPLLFKYGRLNLIGPLVFQDFDDKMKWCLEERNRSTLGRIQHLEIATVSPMTGSSFSFRSALQSSSIPGYIGDVCAGLGSLTSLHIHLAWWPTYMRNRGMAPEDLVLALLDAFENNCFPNVIEFWYRCDSEDDQLIGKIPNSFCEQLRFLSIHPSGFNEYDALDLVEKCPNLEELAIICDLANLRFHPKHKGLRHLSLKNSTGTQDQLIKLITRLPSAEALQEGSPHAKAKENPLEQLVLWNICLEFWEEEEDEDPVEDDDGEPVTKTWANVLNSITKQCPNLKGFQAKNLDYGGNTWLGAPGAAADLRRDIEALDELVETVRLRAGDAKAVQCPGEMFKLDGMPGHADGYFGGVFDDFPLDEDSEQEGMLFDLFGIDLMETAFHFHQFGGAGFGGPSFGGPSFGGPSISNGGLGFWANEADVGDYSDGYEDEEDDDDHDEDMGFPFPMGFGVYDDDDEDDYDHDSWATASDGEDGSEEDEDEDADEEEDDDEYDEEYEEGTDDGEYEGDSEAVNIVVAPTQAGFGPALEGLIDLSVD